MRKAEWIALFFSLAGVVPNGQMTAPRPPEPQSMDDAWLTSPLFSPRAITIRSVLPLSMPFMQAGKSFIVTC